MGCILRRNLLRIKKQRSSQRRRDPEKIKKEKMEDGNLAPGCARAERFGDALVFEVLRRAPLAECRSASGQARTANSGGKPPHSTNSDLWISIETGCAVRPVEKRQQRSADVWAAWRQASSPGSISPELLVDCAPAKKRQQHGAGEWAASCQGSSPGVRRGGLRPYKTTWVTRASTTAMFCISSCGRLWRCLR
jgi:hypothetical protein